MIFCVCFVVLLLLAGCTYLPATSPTSAPAPTPIPGLDESIAGGLRFLKGQYNPNYGLLQESPAIGQHRYFLTNDNALAAYVFEQLGEKEMAERLRGSLQRYGYDSNGFVEAAWGEAITWPPLHHGNIVVEQKTAGNCDFPGKEDEPPPLADCVFQETHTPDLGFFYDWSSFSNLHCMGAVNEYNRGNLTVAQWLYDTELSTFDGIGWADEAWRRREGVYETIGPAWCLYAGARLGAPVDSALLQALLAQQDPETGGFHTHYRKDQFRLADPNVETTSLALLALYTLQHMRPAH